MIGTHYNRPPNIDNVQTLIELLGEPRYRNSHKEVVPFEASVIRRAEACGSSGCPWIEEDYAKVSVDFDRAGWDKDIKKYQAAHLPFPLPQNHRQQMKIQKERKIDVSGLTSYFSQQYLRRAFLPTMDAFFAAISIRAPTWPEQPYGSWIDDSVVIPELSLKFDLGVSCVVVSYRPPHLMETRLKIEELQEERGNHRYSKEDIAEALAQHFHSAVTLPLPESKLPVGYSKSCVGAGIRS